MASGPVPVRSNPPPRDGWVTIAETREGKFDGYVSLPERGWGPGLILLQEIWGVNDHIKAIADDYAAEGYVVLAPDIYWRDGLHTALSYDPEGTAIARKQHGRLDFDKASDDLAKCASFLVGSSIVIGGIASLGFCLGGRLSFLASHVDGISASVSYYGSGLGGNPEMLQRSRAPMLFHFAEDDHLIPLSELGSWIPQLARGGSMGLYIYKGLRHGFNCPFRDSYAATEAGLARSRTLTYLRQHIG